MHGTAPSPDRGPNVDPSLLHHFFTRSAARYPRRIAVDVPPGERRPVRHRMTYAQVDEQSDVLAANLRALVQGECIVAIFLPRDSHHLYVAQLAVMKAGAAYTCLDPSFPDEHCRFILEDTSAVALLSNRDSLGRASSLGICGCPVLDMDKLIDRKTAASQSPPPWLEPSSLAYVIYTSGTTGHPKGVMIEHGSVANLVGSDVERYRLTPEDRVSQNSSASYDSSVEEIWLAFAVGATLVVMDDEDVRLGPDLVQWLRREAITVLCPSPTMLRTTGCADPEGELPDLGLVYSGGEALPRDLADRWAPGRWLENGYGPTECTVTVLRERVRQKEPVTIGRPLRGNHAWVLDASGQEVPDGEEGELCIGGTGLARGYLNRPELTEEKFPTHPRLGRIYHTGDLVRRDQRGDYFFLGRIDSQVKLRGYRIELEEIESHLVQCQGVREAACRIQGDGVDRLLVAFVVPQQMAAPPCFDELEARLRDVMPAYGSGPAFGGIFPCDGGLAICSRSHPGRFVVIERAPSSLKYTAVLRSSTVHTCSSSPLARSADTRERPTAAREA